MNINDYKTYVFDCDGVLLDSNKIKSQSFYKVVEGYGSAHAQTLLEYHIENGGISRHAKLKYFITDIIKKPIVEEEYDSLIQNYGDLVKEKLLSCPITKGMEEFVRSLPSSSYKIIVSGGQENELREIFKERELSYLFDKIYGSPKSKYNIINDQLLNNKIEYPAVLFGDSKLDFLVAKEYNMDFIFIKNYTEFNNWETYFKEKNVPVFGDLSELN